MNTKKERQIPAWKVYFDGSFWGHPDNDEPGIEQPVEKYFYRDKEEWMIPSIYSCSKGLVVDIIKKIPADCIRRFIDKWHLTPDKDDEDYTEEQLCFIQLENPLKTDFHPEIILNHNRISFSHLSGNIWNPLLPEQNDEIIQDTLKHYHLDPDFGWSVCRCSFPWGNDEQPDTLTNRPQIRSLSIRLLPEREEIPGPHFHVTAPGKQVPFIYTPTGTAHTLIVQEYTTEQIPNEHTADPDREYPNYFTVMGYTLTPALPPDCLTLSDCSKNDNPRMKTNAMPKEPDSYTDSDIIGGADGPTAIFFSKSGACADLLYAASSVHFQPVRDVEWKMAFHEKRKPEICVDIM